MLVRYTLRNTIEKSNVIMILNIRKLIIHNTQKLMRQDIFHGIDNNGSKCLFLSRHMENSCIQLMQHGMIWALRWKNREAKVIVLVSQKY